MTIRTAIVVWEDDTLSNDFDGGELAAAIRRADDNDHDGQVFFIDVVEGVSVGALTAGADPVSWGDGYARCTWCGHWQVCTDLDDQMTCKVPGQGCT